MDSTSTPTPSRTRSLKIRKVGNSLGVVLTRDLLDALGVAEGDTLFPVRTPTGIELTAYDPDFAAALDANRGFMRRHRDALRALSVR